jgi:2-C-methyl-D-erythritol 4-phosphate cytidylyltransferase
MTKAVILAGGIGSRFLSDIPKQFLKLDGTALISHTIDACISSKNVNSILIVCNSDYIETLSTVINTNHKTVEQSIKIIPGGRTRIESTLIAFSYLDCKIGDSIILLEANRPFITSEQIDKICLTFVKKKADCVLFYSKLKESLFYFENESEISSLDRSKYILTQTPYILSGAAASDIVLSLKHTLVSDDIDILSLLSSSRIKVALESHFNNIKITNPEDLLFAEAIIKFKNEK